MSVDLSDLELERIGRTLPVPTVDDQVIKLLSKYGEPLLPSETIEQRRKRLLLLMARRHLQGLCDDDDDDVDDPNVVDKSPQEFYTKGSDDLENIRGQIKSSSLDASRRRLDLQKAAANAYATCDMQYLENHVNSRQAIVENMISFSPIGTESGFSRPVSSVVFGSTAETVYAGDWSGKLYTLNSSHMEIQQQHDVHAGKVCLRNTRHGIISGGVEGNIVVRESGTTFNSKDRVASIDIHPYVNVIAGAYYDCTYKIWDLESGKQLLTQPGHSKPVYALKFHPDGSLLVSAGLDGIARIWDLRSGRTVTILDKHVREIYAVDWCSDGYTLATGGADNNVYIWDLRQKVERMLPAHVNIVSCVKYVDSILLTGSYDKTIKLWNTYTGNLLNTKQISEKVMSLDIDKNRDTMVVGKWDRTVDFYRRR